MIFIKKSYFEYTKKIKKLKKNTDKVKKNYFVNKIGNTV